MPCEVNGKNCFTWDEGEICFSNNPYCWDDVCIALEIEEAVSTGIASSWLGAYEGLEKQKKKRFITLITEVNDKTTKQTKEVKKIKITSENVQLTVETILKTVRIEKNKNV